MAAVLVLVGVAAVDAIRTRGGDEKEEVVSMLREAGVSGTLVYTDPACVLRAVSLPDLAEAPAPEGPPTGCPFALSPDGRRIAPGGAAWSGSPRAYALCRDQVVDVYEPPNAQPGFLYDGCVPSWRRERSPPERDVLTVVRGGRVIEVRPACASPPPCERSLLTRDAIFQAAVRHPDIGVDLSVIDDIDIRAVAWLSATRVAVLLDIRVVQTGGLQLVALYGSGAPLATRALPGRPDALSLDVSPGRAYVAVEPGPILRADASELRLPVSLRGRATRVAWSPDEAWLALATRGSVVLLNTRELERFEGGGPEPTAIRIPLDVRELAWR